MLNQQRQSTEGAKLHVDRLNRRFANSKCCLAISEKRCQIAYSLLWKANRYALYRMLPFPVTLSDIKLSQNTPIFGRQYYRSSLWYTVSSVCLSSVRRLSVVCNVLYCGETVRPSEKVSEGGNRKPGSKSSFLGSRHISTSGFAATATKTAVFALFLLV